MREKKTMVNAMSLHKFTYFAKIAEIAYLSKNLLSLSSCKAILMNSSDLSTNFVTLAFWLPRHLRTA